MAARRSRLARDGSGDLPGRGTGFEKNQTLSRVQLSSLRLLASVIDFNVWQEVEGYGRALHAAPAAYYRWLWPTRWAFLPLLLILPRALIFPVSETLKALLHWAVH